VVFAWCALLSKEQAFMCAVLYGAYESLALYHTARIQRFHGNRIRQVLCHSLPYILLRIGHFIAFLWVRFF
jgi:hypothetical protein